MRRNKELPTLPDKFTQVSRAKLAKLPDFALKRALFDGWWDLRAVRPSRWRVSLQTMWASYRVLMSFDSLKSITDHVGTNPSRVLKTIPTVKFQHSYASA